MAAQDYRAVVRLRPRTAPVALDTIAVTGELDAPPSRVFGAVQALGIAVGVEDSSRGLLGNEKLVRRLNLAGQPLSRFESRLSTAIKANLLPGLG